MSLSLSLNNALSGLNINQQSLSVLSQNIANANTQGYTRKIVNQQAVYLDGKGAGVSITDISRKVDNYLLKATRQQGAALGRTAVGSDYADRTQLLLGNPGGQNSLPSFINNFFNSVQSLAQTPENSTLRVNAVNSANSMAREISNLAQSLQDMRLQAETDITESIGVINRDLLDLKALNSTITNDALLGKNVGELLDRRDATLKDLSTYLDIGTYLKANGAITVFTSSGVSLLDDSAYQLAYNPQTSTSAFVSDAILSPLNVYRLDEEGNRMGTPVALVSAGRSSQVTSALTGGKLRGLVEARDHQLPNLLAQLDNLASNMRDQFNEVHNTGIGFPGANSYTGTRSVNAQDYSNWTGNVRFALLDSTGKAAPSVYPDEPSGMRPFKMDLGSLNSGLGTGNPTVQGIINEFNQYYGAPQNKAVVGNLNNIRLASDTATLPGSPPQLQFDFDLENISDSAADFFVTGVQVLDNTGTDMTSVTSTIPSVDLAATGTYITTAGSSTVTVNTDGAHNFDEGQRIYLSAPPGAVDGIPAANLGGFFTIFNVTSTGFDIAAGADATAGGSNDVAAMTAKPKYAEVAAGDYGRSHDSGIITADLSANTVALYYTIKVNVAVEDEDGNLTTSQLTYQVDNAQSGLLNHRYAVKGVTGGGSLVAPTSQQAIARAILVNSEGRELTKVNGVYSSQDDGYLKIIATNSSYSFGIDSMDSAEGGKPSSVPVVEGTNRGFSYFFELNNFFKSYDDEGDTVTNSAINLAMEERLIENPNLISLGQLVQSRTPADATTYYTYERNIGDNSVIQRLSALASTVVNFASAGGIGQTSVTVSSYAGAIIGGASSSASSYQSDVKNAQALMDGFSDRSDSISGVNLDEELANTIIYQNAYTASTRVISVVNELFDVLINTFGR